MTTYRFNKYEFNSESYELRADNVLLALRPKTAVLMAVLIEQRQHLLGKKALFSQVWHSDHVQHQSLFQAISEIRKILAPLQPIKTHPNLGYQWVAPVRQLRERRWLGRWLGRSAVVVVPLAAVSALLIWNWQTPTPVMAQVVMQAEMQANTKATNTSPGLINSQSMLQSPAMQAFSNGIEYLNKQQLADALNWDLQADSNARNQGFACVAENTRIRIAGLLGETDQPVNAAWVSRQSELTEPIAKDEEVLANDYPDATHCESLHEKSEADPMKPDLSQCLDIGSEHQNLAMNTQQDLSSHRWA